MTEEFYELAECFGVPRWIWDKRLMKSEYLEYEEVETAKTNNNDKRTDLEHGLQADTIQCRSLIVNNKCSREETLS